MAAASGVLLGLSFPPFSFGPLAWIALVPLLYAWQRQPSARACMIDAYLAFLATFAVAFQWPLFHAFPETAWLSLPGLLIVPMWMAVPFGLAAPFRRRLGRPGGLLMLACLFLLMEFTLRRGPLAFPWTLLGHTQAELFPINQLASLGGVPALSALVLATNYTILSILRRPPAGAIAFAFLLPAILWIPGASQDGDRFSRTPQEPGELLRVALVQPAVPAERWADLGDATRVAHLMRLSEHVPDGVDLVVWPETALPPSDSVFARVRRWSAERELRLLSGAIIPADPPGMFYNAAMLYKPDEPVQVYRKERLVPFAERVPLSRRWPWMRNLAIPSGGAHGYAIVKNNRLFEIRKAQVGVQICFETLFDDAARSYALRGADLIVAITQDGWWGDSFGYRQHLAFTRLRAIETSLPIVQASVSGISALILPDGRIASSSGWMEEAVLVVRVPRAIGSTFYTRYGDWMTLLALALVVILIVRTGFVFYR